MAVASVGPTQLALDCVCPDRGALPATHACHHPSLHLIVRESVRRRTGCLELGTSGTVRGEGGNVLTYSDNISASTTQKWPAFKCQSTSRSASLQPRPCRKPKLLGSNSCSKI